MCEDVRVISSAKEVAAEISRGCSKECGKECREGGEMIVLVWLISVPVCAWV